MYKALWAPQEERLSVLKEEAASEMDLEIQTGVFYVEGARMAS